MAMREPHPVEEGRRGRLPAGKLPHDLLRSLLGSLAQTDPTVVVGPRVGEDAAVIDLGGEQLLVAKTDPITFATRDAARYLLAVNSNDLATMGAEPRWLLVTALLPEGIATAEAASIFEDLKAACTQAGVSLVGGHTEMTMGLNRPILVGCLLGTVPRERLVRSSGARPGDAVILAGGVAIEGTAILALEHAGELRRRGVPESVIRCAAGWLEAPGICVLPAARLLSAAGGVHAMHDPTEGGVATALYELAEASGLRLRVRRDAIPILPECRTVTEALGLDPLALLASGALLAAVDPAVAPAALERLHEAGIPAAIVGEALPPAEGRPQVEDETGMPLAVLPRDELARFLESASR